jgi:hypothetical protein
VLLIAIVAFVAAYTLGPGPATVHNEPTFTLRSIPTCMPQMPCADNTDTPR